MKKWLKKWLGITDLEQRLYDLDARMDESEAKIVNTLYDEFDPRRKAASDALGEKHRQRLIAEDKARRHTLGEL